MHVIRVTMIERDWVQYMQAKDTRLRVPPQYIMLHIRGGIACHKISYNYTVVHVMKSAGLDVYVHKEQHKTCTEIFNGRKYLIWHNISPIQ